MKNLRIRILVVSACILFVAIYLFRFSVYNIFGFYVIDSAKSYNGIYFVTIDNSGVNTQLLCDRETYELVKAHEIAYYFIQFINSRVVPEYGIVVTIVYDDDLTKAYISP